MNLKPFYSCVILALLVCTHTCAAFPIRSSNTMAVAPSCIPNTLVEPVTFKKENKTTAKSRLSNSLYKTHIRRYSSNDPDDRRTIAIVLSLLGLFGILGIHRMYYGYWGIGVFQFLGLLAFCAGAFLLLVVALGGTAAPGLLLVSGIVLFAWGITAIIWQLVDFIRLLCNTLRPNGEQQRRGNTRYGTRSVR